MFLFYILNDLISHFTKHSESESTNSSLLPVRCDDVIPGNPFLLVNMADAYQQDNIEENLECSSSSFEESSDGSDEETPSNNPATQREQLGVRPYRFEPERNEDVSGSDSENEGQGLVGDEWFVRLFAYFFDFLLFLIWQKVAKMSITNMFLQNWLISREGREIYRQLRSIIYLKRL